MSTLSKVKIVKNDRILFLPQNIFSEIVHFDEVQKTKAKRFSASLT
jgi:hypothetical protein